MKNILKSLVVVVAVAVIGAQATLAAFTAQATVTGNTFSTGNAALMLWNNLADSGSLVSTKTGEAFSGIYPGWTRDYGVKLQNTGTVDLVTSATGVYVSDDGDLRNQLLVAAFAWTDDGDGVVEPLEVGAAFQDWKTLEQWRSSPIPFTEVENGATQSIVLRFLAPADLGPQYQGKTTVFDFVFNGTTDGAVQE